MVKAEESLYTHQICNTGIIRVCFVVACNDVSKFPFVWQQKKHFESIIFTKKGATTTSIEPLKYFEWDRLLSIIIIIVAFVWVYVHECVFLSSVRCNVTTLCPHVISVGPVSVWSTGVPRGGLGDNSPTFHCIHCIFRFFSNCVYVQDYCPIFNAPLLPRVKS